MSKKKKDELNITLYADGTHLSYTNTRIAVKGGVKLANDKIGNLIEVKHFRSEPADKQIGWIEVKQRGLYSICHLALSDEALKALTITCMKELQRREQKPTEQEPAK